jgi:signal transduction histidine kinase
VTEHWSLRTRLLTALVTLAAALFGLSSVQNYLAWRDTSGRLFDGSLRGSAGLLLQLAEHEIAEHGQVLGIALLRAETSAGPYGFQFQVWTPDMQAGARSAQLPTTPLLPFTIDGFGWTTIAGERWRAYSVWNNAHTLQIQIAQPQDQRHLLDRQALLRLLVNAVILLGLAGGFIWWIVTATIRPLQQTADSVGQRSERDLGTVDTRGAPREVQPLLDALNHLLRRTAETLQKERRFTADAAHELRTPLAAIRANAQVLVAARDAAEQQGTARDLIASVDRSTRLVEQLLALARADQADNSAQQQEVDLAAITAEQLQAHAALAVRQRIALRGNLQAVQLRGDPALLAVLVRNLVDNALRYTPAGGAVQVSTATQGNWAILEVDDSGPGIPVEERQRVFERFYRVAGVRATGSGLGLSIVQRIAELHGASVSLTEGPAGAGTRVRVMFPLLHF